MKKTLLLVLGLIIIFTAFTQDFPSPMNPPRLVNDFANLLNESEKATLESKLVDFNNKTSTQISIVIVNSLNGYEVGDYGVRLAQKWGIGQKGNDNGILITIKPKDESPGQANLTIGYGLEHIVPDAISGRIIDHEMIPRFKLNDYYGGLNQATTVLIELTKGEYTADNYLNETSAGSESAIGGFITLMIIILIFRGIFGRKRYSGVGRRSSLPFWLAAGMMSSGHSHGGSFGNFSSGGGSFGGFGGGGFGGGGASGSW